MIQSISINFYSSQHPIDDGVEVRLITYGSNAPESVVNGILRAI